MSGSVAVTRAIAVPGLLLLLIIATALSLLIGAKSLPASVVLEAFSGTCQSADGAIVRDARLPRTLAGLLAGGALGLAGALMQTLTRNPLADPGLLGVNAGASFAIVLGAALFGYSSAQEQLAMAFAGALVASLIVAFTGSQGGGQLSPVRLTLAGVALAGGVFYLFSTLLHLSGMNDTNGEGLVLVAGQTGLELHWLLLVAVLISSLGAVMDVALSLASSLHELREADGKMSGLQLFAAGMRIGRDMIGTMSNTLILAFAGEAVTTLLLLMAYGWHSSQLFASDYAAIQVAQGVASTLGVVLGVPITSGICAALYRPLKR